MNQSVSRNKGLNKEFNSKMVADPTNNSNVNKQTNQQNSLKHSSNFQNNSLKTNTNSSRLNNNTLDENHNTKQIDKDHQSHSTHTPALKATPDQLRIAQLSSVNKNEDPEINKKIKQVLDMFPDKNQDEILMVLHEKEYDVNKTIDTFVDGVDLSLDWKTAGPYRKKQTTSPNQTFDESEVQVQQTNLNQLTNRQAKFNKNKATEFNDQINNTNLNNSTNKEKNIRSRERNRNSIKGKFRKPENNNFDENLASLDIRDNDLNYKSDLGENENLISDQQQLAQNGRKRGNYSLSRGGGRGGRIGAGVNRGRSSGILGSYRPRGQRNEIDSNFKTNQSDNNNNLSSNYENSNLTLNAPRESSGENENTHVVNNNEISNNGSGDSISKKYANSRSEDNLRDIGTWSNEQADRNNSNNRSSYHKPMHYGNRQYNRHNNNNRNPNNNLSNQTNHIKVNDDWENEEEWQGDLTQTQIFTASAQKKDTTEPNSDINTYIPRGDQNPTFDSNFPIGHFNAEEAAQKIKNAVGIGNVNQTNKLADLPRKNPMTNQCTDSGNAIESSKNIVNSHLIEIKENDQHRLSETTIQSQRINHQTQIAQEQHPQTQQPQTIQQQSQQVYRINKIASVKPPPPSTKIPKSAVVMPDGSNSSFNLDVQFGVDLDSPLIENRENSQMITESINQKLNINNQVQIQNQKSIQQAVNKPIVVATTQPQSISQSSYSNSSINLSNEKLTNVGVVNPVISSNNSGILSSGVKVVSQDSSLINIGNGSNQASHNKTGVDMDNSSDHLTNSGLSVSSTNNSTLGSASLSLQQQNQSQHQNAIESIKKLNQENFIDSKQKTSTVPQSHYQTQLQQIQPHHHQLNLQKQQIPQQQQAQQSKQHHPQYLSQLNQNENILNQSQSSQQQQQQQQQSQAHIQRDSNNHHHHTNNNLNSHHYQQHHHSQQLNPNSQINVSNSNQIKDASAVQNISTSQSSNSQLLNISPQNIIHVNSNNKSNNVPNSQQPQSSNLSSNNVQLSQQSQQQTLQPQLQQISQQNNNLGQQQQPSGLGSNQNPLNANNPTVNAANAKQNAIPPPPGVNLQNFPYFDPTQIDGNSIMQMYNHLAGVPPPGVGSAAGANAATPGGPPYSMSESKFNRSEAAGSNSQLNAVAAAAAQLSQQQQQPINLIPGLSNFPFFFHNYYPNMFMSVPNGPQANPQFQNKPPYNFNNSTGYDDQNKDYPNYNPQSQLKSSALLKGSNLNNVSEISGVGYQKNVDKSTAGYHTPPPNYSNSLMNQPHPNVGATTGAPPTQYTYITSMIGTPGGNPLVHSGMQQENLNSRGIANTGTNNLKQLQKTANYPNSPWS